jgi:hypothetical protein
LEKKKRIRKTDFDENNEFLTISIFRKDKQRMQDIGNLEDRYADVFSRVLDYYYKHKYLVDLREEISRREAELDDE